MPELIASRAAKARRQGSTWEWNAIQAAHEGENEMNTDRPDPNAELHTREPLRIVFAIAALLLGVIASLHV